MTDLKELHGKLLLFGGVYSNLEALEELFAIAEREGIPTSNMICTGDVVGYCASAESVCQKVAESGIHVIAGNVEIQLREGEEDCGCDFDEGGRCDSFSRQWYPFAQKQLSKSSIEWMLSLPEHLVFQHNGQRFGVVHGSYFKTSEFIFESTPWQIKAPNFEAMKVDAIIAGHSGLPFLEENGKQTWLNPGVIGMPANDGTPRVWCTILEEHKVPRFIAYNYDHHTAAQRMRDHRLPEPYAKTLETGIWDNCEILPQEETDAQGKRIELA